MPIDYDAPQRRDVGDEDESLEALKDKGATQRGGLDDSVDPTEAEFDLPGDELPAEDLTVRVVPVKSDEFTCRSCFLVHHRSQLADADEMLCVDCAG